MFWDRPLTKRKDNEGKYNPFVRASKIAAVGVAASFGFRKAMRRPGAPERLFKYVSAFEEMTPNWWGKTFALSEIASSYLPQKLSIPRKDLFVGNDLSAMGEHFHRLIGGHFDIHKLDPTDSLNFFRTDPGSSFLNLANADGIKVRFSKAGGRLAASSSLLKAELAPKAFGTLPSYKGHPVKWFEEVLNQSKKWQTSSRYSEAIGVKLIPEVEEGFQPVSSRLPGIKGFFQTAASETERVGLLLTERMQRLMTDTARIGLPGNSYNRLMHVPFLGGKNVGIINELLTKRALPAYLAVGVALPFLDYLTHHVVSNTILNVIQKTKIAHAYATDLTPGARKVTDWYEKTVPGPQYGPVALPLLGITAGGLYHYGKVITGQFASKNARLASSSIRATQALKDKVIGTKDVLFGNIFGGLNKKSPIFKGLAIGLAAMIPFIPGMLGSRNSPRELQDIYSGEEPVPIRSGRWWELGTTPWSGNRIKEYRSHWSVLHRTQAQKISLYGSEKEYWQHHPILHPLRWLRDPYYLEKRHYEDRPYPVTSPAFSNVPLIGPVLAATIGRLLKPVVRMHPEWSGEEYNLASSRLEPRGPQALPPPLPTTEYSLKGVVSRESRLFTDLIGLPGFIANTLWNKAFPDQHVGENIQFEGSRQMMNISRKYYEKELGAGALAGGPTEGLSEPLRRFIQPDYQNIPQANQIKNTMPSWLPGEDYFINFRIGDPYVNIPEGYARLPGAAYEALHPETAGLDPEDYPDLSKMSILADVAPYSIEYRRQESRVKHLSTKNTEMRIEYEKITQRVKEMKDSVVNTDDRRFSEEITKSTGTVSRVTRSGIELSEFPGREFNLSSVGYSASDQSAIVLGEHNNWNKSQIAEEVERRQARLIDFFNNNLAPGTRVGLVTPKGAIEGAENITAVLTVGNTNFNKSLILEGLGQYRKDLGGPESQAMFGSLGRLFGKIAENLSFTGDESRLNPLRYVPSPFHTKYWQERTPLSQYQQQEVEGTRLRRWQHPLADFIMPYARGAYRRIIGDLGTPSGTQTKRDLNTLTDMLDYVRGIQKASKDSEHRGKYTSQASRTAVGANAFGTPIFLASTLPSRDAAYFNRFIKETNPEIRTDILNSVPEEMKQFLSAQWVKQQANIATAEGKEIPDIGEGGRLYTDEGLEAYSKADTKLDYGDYQRSQEVAAFFSSRKLNLPEDPSSPLYDPNIDYEDVKLKIIQNEGYDMHDFGIFDDRAALLWRKPYIDGAVRELTGSDGRSTEQIRRSVEDMIIASHDRNPKVSMTANQARRDNSNIRVDVSLDQSEEILKDMRRNPENYQQ